MKIDELLSNYVFETKKVEFKKRLDSPKQLTWLKTIGAFANGLGGDLIIGVDDKHNLCGFLENEIDGEIRKINNAVKAKIEPHILFDFKYVPYVEDNQKRYLIILKIPRSKKLPVIVREDNLNTIYVRDEASTVAASSEQIRNLIIASEAITNDQVDTLTKFNESDFKKLYSFYKEETGETLTKKKLAVIDFFNSDDYLKKGSLLFADNCNDNNTIIHCRLWNSLTKGASIVLDNKEEKGNLLDTLKFALKFIMANTKTGFIKESIGRKEIFSYPQRAITEALINALAHRNYLITGSQIDIDIFKNRLEITSPGSLLGASFKDKDTDLKAIPSKRRNQLICDVFALCKLMEKSGSGFEKIIDDYSHYDDKYKPYVSCTNDYFTITLMDVLYDGEGLSDEKFTFAPISEGKRDKDYQIIEYCLYEYHTAKEIADRIGIKKSTYFMNQYLKPLLENNYLLRFSTSLKNPTQKYLTNKEKLIFK